MIIRANDRVVFVRSNKGRIARIVREHYIRDDLGCRFPSCLKCISQTSDNFQVLGTDLYHCVILDLDQVFPFMDVLESRAIKNVVIGRSFFTLLESKGYKKQKLYQLMQFLNDARNTSFLFDNEHFGPTYSVSDTEKSRSMFKLAYWYTMHFREYAPQMTVVYITDNPEFTSLAMENGVVVQTWLQYLNNYHADNPDFHKLVESISISMAERHLPLDMATEKEELFGAHWDDDVLEACYKSRSILKGRFVVHSSNYKYARVQLPNVYSSKYEITIPTFKNCNRAIHNDIVYVQLLKVIDRTVDGQLSANLDEDLEEATIDDNLEVVLTQMSNDGSNELYGTVLGIASKETRLHVYTLKIGQEKNLSKRWLIAHPWDYRLPNIRFYTHQHSNLVGCRLLMRIGEWPVTEHIPYGHYVKNLGPIDSFVTEINTIWNEYQVTNTTFPQQALDTIISAKESSIRIKDGDIRKDLRSWRIFSIDPYNSKSIDDALSCHRLPNGNIQIGIHISDVCAFLPENSSLDLEARRRSSNMYFARNVFKMLPEVLSDNLCSLLEDKDRYALSVILEFNDKYDIVDRWIGRTLVRSCHKLSYTDANDILLDSFAMKDSFKYYTVLRNELKVIHTIYNVLKSRRVERGGFELEKPNLTFIFNAFGEPCKIQIHKIQDINLMVAEYMILANGIIAEFLVKNIGRNALLRYHPPPPQYRFSRLLQVIQETPFDIDIRSNVTLSKSLLNIRKSADYSLEKVVSSILSTCLENGEYIIYEPEKNYIYSHYGLGLDFYTHFTSPIRRYPDIVVHRQLISIFEGKYPCTSDFDKLQKITEYINTKNRLLKQATNSIESLYKAIYFKNSNATEYALVKNIEKCSLILFITKYGMNLVCRFVDHDGNYLLPTELGSVKSHQLNAEKTKITFHTTLGQFTIAILAKILVSIQVKHSHYNLDCLTPKIINLGCDINSTSSSNYNHPNSMHSSPSSPLQKNTIENVSIQDASRNVTTIDSLQPQQTLERVTLMKHSPDFKSPAVPSNSLYSTLISVKFIVDPKSIPLIKYQKSPIHIPPYNGTPISTRIFKKETYYQHTNYTNTEENNSDNYESPFLTTEKIEHQVHTKQAQKKKRWYKPTHI